MSPDLETQPRRMAATRQISAADVDTKRLMPVFAPSNFFSAGEWQGPHIRLKVQGLGLTWAIVTAGAPLTYVTFEMQAFWDGMNLDWKRTAMTNLATATSYREGARTLCRPSGKPYAIAFLYEDGLGSSRLLLRQSLERMFPAGYQVAVPERSFGFAFSADVSTAEARTVQDIVDRCHRNGAYPLLPGARPAADLLPEGASILGS